MPIHSSYRLLFLLSIISTMVQLKFCFGSACRVAIFDFVFYLFFLFTNLDFFVKVHCWSSLLLLDVVLISLFTTLHLCYSFPSFGQAYISLSSVVCILFSFPHSCWYLGLIFFNRKFVPVLLWHLVRTALLSILLFNAFLCWTVSRASFLVAAVLLVSISCLFFERLVAGHDVLLLTYTMKSAVDRVECLSIVSVPSFNAIPLFFPCYLLPAPVLAFFLAASFSLHFLLVCR